MEATTQVAVVRSQGTSLALSENEARVVNACRAAEAAMVDGAVKAVIAGQLLAEHRESLIPSHSGKGSPQWTDHGKPQDQKFGVWLVSVGISKSTAYRWMDAAERVARGILKIPTAMPFLNTIDVEGQVIPLSVALTAPMAELSDKARDFRQAFFDFMKDKTLSEAVKCAVDGDSPAHRISRAASGKGAANKGDRKNWPEFIALKLSDVSTHLGHWKQFTTGQKEATEEAFKRALAKWPTALLEDLSKSIKAEMGKR